MSIWRREGCWPRSRRRPVSPRLDGGRDDDNDGLINGADAGIAGVVLTLTGTDNLGDDVSLTTTTDASGNYALDGLRPGIYTITETQPAGYLSGINTIGTQGGIAAPPTSDVLANIVLPVGVVTNGTGNNFGELLPGSLGGTVYWDVNHNGRLDSPDYRTTHHDDFHGVPNFRTPSPPTSVHEPRLAHRPPGNAGDLRPGVASRVGRSSPFSTVESTRSVNRS